MDNKKNGIPKLRFPGFTGAWEQRKLSELIQKGGSGGTPKSTNKAYYNGNIPFLGISDISKSNGYIDDTEKYISEKGLDNSSAWIVPKGAISLAMYASVGKLAILNTDAATSQAFYNMVFEDVSIRDYVYHRLGKANEFGEWTRLISTGTQSNLNADKVKNFKIQIPQIINEIKNISTFFNQLDSLIALHQRKLEHLQEQKKGLLQKMFPKNGEVVPEVRFPGFTDAWEQRKLGEVVERRIEKRRQSERYPRLAFASGQGVIPLSERKTNNREQLTKDEFTKKYLVTELDDIVYNPANVKYGAIDRNKYGRGLISPIYVTFTTEEVPGFIERIVKSHDFKQKALRFEEGTVTKRQSVNPEDLVTINILVASQKKEQKKISLFFDNIDTLIALHQRKLEHLELMKKGLLQQMFV